jgi:hypothetical protein
MSEINSKLKDPGIGDFVDCYFPDLDSDPTTPSKAPHTALVIAIGYDEVLNLKTYTLVHASDELERNLHSDSSFGSMAREVVGRVAITESTDRIINYDYVTILPICAVFFGDLARHAHIRILGSIDRNEIEKIRPKLATPNAVAIKRSRCTTRSISQKA